MSGVEFTGPFSSYDVIVDGRRIPDLQAHMGTGGKVLLTCDRSVGVELPVAIADEVTRFVAFAMDIAQRGRYAPRVHEVDAVRGDDD